jgi:hypothetical protein
MKNADIPRSLILITIVLILITILLRYYSPQDDFITDEDGFSQDEELEDYTELKVYQYVYKDGKVDKASKVLLHYYTYDEKGNVLTHSELIKRKKNRYQKQVNKYNEANMLTESIDYDTNGNKKKYTIINYLKDDTTKAEQINEIYGEKLFKAIYKYDNKGNEVSFTHYTDGKITQKTNTTYTYNKKGEPEKEIKKYYTGDSNKSPETITTTTYTYNENGEKKEKSVYEITYKESKKSIFTSNTTYTYNKKGKLEKEYSYSSSGSTATKTFTYNEKGLVVEIKSVSIHFVFTFKFKYNNKGLQIEETFSTAEQDPATLFVYKYK